ncbi:MAG: crtZ [Ilumatobacteraceae bacterium]|nr:crtZ [Ilumatobacteraceae bacterium]
MRLLALCGVAIVVFVAMEGVSYATHRWVMHGFGMRWHRSHHVPRPGRWEANDVFPAVFSVLGFGVFLTAAVTRSGVVYAVAIGITAYGIAYAFVHDISIHRRVSIPVPQSRYLRWVGDAHGIHHLFGGEPYGMLLPVVSSALRDRAGRRAAESDRETRRSSTRTTRRRL